MLSVQRTLQVQQGRPVDCHSWADRKASPCICQQTLAKRCQYLHCTGEAIRRKGCPSRLFGIITCHSYMVRMICGFELHTICCVLLQSKTAEHREHFGVFQDPHLKSQWEKAGDLRCLAALFHVSYMLKMWKAFQQCCALLQGCNSTFSRCKRNGARLLQVGVVWGR